jgi:hypothetical protein
MTFVVQHIGALHWLLMWAGADWPESIYRLKTYMAAASSNLQGAQSEV